MPISEPLQMTSYLPSWQNDFNEVAQSGHFCSSSKNISVFCGINRHVGSISEMFLMMVSTS